MTNIKHLKIPEPSVESIDLRLIANGTYFYANHFQEGFLLCLKFYDGVVTIIVNKFI